MEVEDTLSMATIHCLGDSHTEAFRHASTLRTWENTSFEFCIVPGASAMRAINPNSGINAQHVIVDYLKLVSHDDTLLFCLGEVDCGFIIWYRAMKHPELSVNELFELSLRHYLDLIDGLIKEGFKKFIVTSASLPTIMDGQDWGEVANARKEVKTPLRDRVNLALKFNDRLSQYRRRGLRYLGYDNEILDPLSGLVRAEFMNSNKLDHHLEPSGIAPVLVEKLMGLGYK